MSKDDNRHSSYQPTHVGDPVWSAKSAKDRADATKALAEAEERRYAELLEAIRQVRNQVAHSNSEFGRSLGDEVGDHVVEAARAEAVREGKTMANIGGLEFSAVGSVDAAMHTARPFSSGPVLQNLSESTPHELAALKEKSIGPSKLGFDKPDGFTDAEFVDVLSSYAGAELLDRERRFIEAREKRDHSRARWDSFWKVVAPLLAAALAALLTWFGLR